MRSPLVGETLPISHFSAGYVAFEGESIVELPFKSTISSSVTVDAGTDDGGDGGSGGVGGDRWADSACSGTDSIGTVKCCVSGILLGTASRLSVFDSPLGS